MKKLILSVVAIVTIALNSFGQSPEGFKYQAVIRDAGTILNNQSVGVQMTIQQGSIGGTEVYQETFAPTTNSYGLVNLEIGTGTTTDDFTSIDWAAGPYFIETAVDVAGGISYVVMGTSQLLSVPYALHANTADSIAGGIVENQSVSDVVALGNSVNDQLKNVTDPTDAQDAVTKAYVDALEARLDSLEDRIVVLEPAKIGDLHEGGIVFYIDETGEHGLVVALVDQSQNAEWGCYGVDVPGASSFSIGTGNQNTLDIIAGCSDAGTAAKICGDLTLNGYSDWFLGTYYEMTELQKAITEVELGLSANNGESLRNGLFFWSSLESGVITNQAWGAKYNNNGTYDSQNIDKNTPNAVRAIRAF